MERSDAGVEERPPDRLRVRVGDLEHAHHRGTGLERFAGIRQGLAEGAREPVPQPLEERNAPRPREEVCTVLGAIPASVSASATACTDASDRRVPMTAFLGVAWNLIPGGVSSLT